MGKARDRAVMYAGTGSTHGWEQWVAKGQYLHASDPREWLEN
jgi:hypothetical protein